MRYYPLSLAMIAVPMLLGTVAAVNAASHREAPFITERPKLDGTDFYMFRSYEPGREDFVTLIANYQPLQDPYGGPNYFTLDPSAIYAIHIDNDGDARPDMSFEFRFQNRVRGIAVLAGGKSVPVPVINVGAIGPGMADNDALNVVETYTVDVVRGNGKRRASKPIRLAGTQEKLFVKPVDNVGAKSLPDYAAYAADHVFDIAIPGCDDGRMFVGQRKDPFVVNLGEIFDLVNVTDPLGSGSVEEDDLADANVTSLILEVPIDCLVDDDSVIGAWTTASDLVSANRDDDDEDDRSKGAARQVSRLGSPLVNELVIGLPDKDRFNGSEPRRDASFAQYVTNPALPEIIELLFATPAPNLFPRGDLVAAFLTGVPGLNQPANVRAAEMLRLNTAIDPTPAAEQNRLGVIGDDLVFGNGDEDLAGFPNGRRPGDDVVDIELRVAMGRLIALDIGFGDPSDAPAGGLDFTDGAFVDAGFFDAAFPYLATPLPGSPNGTP